MNGTVVLDSGRLAIEVLPFGAHLVAVHWPDRSGDRTPNLTKALPSAAAYRDRTENTVLGSVVGRYANRIAGAGFEIDGVHHRVEANEGRNHLHGGSTGLQWKEWTVADASPAHVRLEVTSPAGEGGYPGRLVVAATYRLLDDDGVAIEYEATTDAPTIVNLTNHAYWNLSGTGSVLDHTLHVDADGYVPVDDGGIPTGGIHPVDDTRFDLRVPTRLGDRVGGFDHCFADDAIFAVLRDPASGRQMTVATDQPGLQVYTANHLDPPHTHVCLEAQALPDSPNQVGFPSAVLRPGEPYRHETTHRFEVN